MGAPELIAACSSLLQSVRLLYIMNIGALEEP